MLKVLRSVAIVVGIFLALYQPASAADSFPGPSTTPEEYYCLSLVAGFPQSWLFVMSKGFCVRGTDHIFVHTDWPKELIAGDWDKGFHITNVAGDKDGWVVVMNDASALGEQVYFGPGMFPSEAIAEKLKDDFRITAIAGFNDQWVVVMSKGTGISGQLFTEPTDFEKKQQWLKDHYAEGYRITNLAGDRGRAAAQYVIVLSQKSGIGEQVWIGPGEFPDKWIEQKRSQGYEITAATGYGRWIVVMSNGMHLGDQSWEWGPKLPVTWISKHGRPGVLEMNKVWDFE